MARISEVVAVPVDLERAFDHIADFATTADWDPGISRARRLDAGPLGPGSRFRVELDLGPVSVPLVYEITHYERPHRLVLTTRGAAHHGEDDVRFEATGSGTRLIWNAEFALRGPGRLIDPAFAVGFRRAARDAVAGLEVALRELADH